MLNTVGDVATLLVLGAVAVRIITDKNSRGTLGTVFHGFAEDINAATGK